MKGMDFHMKSKTAFYGQHSPAAVEERVKALMTRLTR